MGNPWAEADDWTLMTILAYVCLKTKADELQLKGHLCGIKYIKTKKQMASFLTLLHGFWAKFFINLAPSSNLDSNAGGKEGKKSKDKVLSPSVPGL